MTSYKLYAVVTAAGSSTRMQSATPKPLLQLETQSGVFSILRLALERLTSAASFDGICVTAPEKFALNFERELSGINPGPQVISGGITRQSSVHLALEYLNSQVVDSDSEAIVLIHDAARCFVPESVVSAAIEAARQQGAATAALPVVDALCKITGQGKAPSPVDREGLYSIQTPQAFQLRRILEAHRQAKAQGREALDDASLLDNVSIVSGARINFKITDGSDLELAKLIAKGLSV